MRRYRRLLLTLAWLANRLQRLCGRTTDVVHRTPILGKPACEACEQREATTTRWSQLENREVFFCDWCDRRFEKLNRRAGEKRAIPRTRKPRRGGGGGRAA